jgi:lariat debranching enzyme
MRVAVLGCLHGELSRLIEVVAALDARAPETPVDLVICCGDFQAIRDEADLATLACPPK